MATAAANTYSETLNDLYFTHRSDFSKDLIESWSTEPSVLKDLMKRAGKSTANPTGRDYEFPVELGTPSGVNRRAFDTAPALSGQTPNINVGARQGIATYEYLMEFNDDRMRLIKDGQALINTQKQLVKNFGKKLRDDVNRDLLATSQATNGVLAIPVVLPTAPTSGTFENISRTTFSDWRPQTTTTGGAFASYGYNQIRSTFLVSSRGNGIDEPDLLITDDATFNAWWQLNDSRDNFWLDDDDEGKTTRRALKFLTAKWCWDHQAPAAKMFGINSKHIELRTVGETGKDEDLQGVTFDPWIHAYNSSKSASIVRWQGALLIKAFKFCFQISGWTF